MFEGGTSMLVFLYLYYPLLFIAFMDVYSLGLLFQVKFGTVSEYFRTVDAEHKADPNFQSLKLVGDFFPYNDRDDQYWTGFYSSRPLHKYMARFLQGRLRWVV
jgi:hypothetical protein